MEHGTWMSKSAYISDHMMVQEREELAGNCSRTCALEPKKQTYL